MVVCWQKGLWGNEGTRSLIFLGFGDWESLWGTIGTRTGPSQSPVSKATCLGTLIWSRTILIRAAGGRGVGELRGAAFHKGPVDLSGSICRGSSVQSQTQSWLFFLIGMQWSGFIWDGDRELRSNGPASSVHQTQQLPHFSSFQGLLICDMWQVYHKKGAQKRSVPLLLTCHVPVPMDREDTVRGEERGSRFLVPRWIDG